MQRSDDFDEVKHDQRATAAAPLAAAARGCLRHCPVQCGVPSQRVQALQVITLTLCRSARCGASCTFAFGTCLRVRCMRFASHPRHAPPGAPQGPRRLGCASSPPLELGRRRSRAGRLASGAVRVRCGPLSSVPARHGAPYTCVRASRCTHATPSCLHRSGTNVPPEGWLCTVGVYCEVCGRYGSQ